VQFHSNVSNPTRLLGHVLASAFIVTSADRLYRDLRGDASISRSS